MTFETFDENDAHVRVEIDNQGRYRVASVRGAEPPRWVFCGDLRIRDALANSVQRGKEREVKVPIAQLAADVPFDTSEHRGHVAHAAFLMFMAWDAFIQETLREDVGAPRAPRRARPTSERRGRR